MRDDIVAIALEAGQAILPYYRAGTGASLKGDGSPVTLADVAAEDIILRRLSERFPGIPAVAEEAAAAGQIPDTDARFFLVDPLDGTKEFVSGSGEFTVNIALVEHGTPVLGAVYAPALGQVYSGRLGEGAWACTPGNGASLEWQAISVRQPPADGLSVVASKSHLTRETGDFIARFAVSQFLSAGSSLKFCLVASGAADLYPRLGRTMEWDTAAADAILRSAGGSVRAMDGEPLRYGKRNQATDSDFANPWFVASGPFDPFSSVPGKSGPT